MIEGLTRVEDPADPLRCQEVTALGQCMFMATIGDKCRVHGGKLANKEAKEEVRNYRLTKYQARVDSFANSDKIKSLREEIGILRMLIEEVVNRCQNSTELILMSGKISSLLVQAEKLVVSCHKLEASTGLLIDKTAIIQLAHVIIDIISEHIKDDTVLIHISDRIVTTIVQTQNTLELK